MKQQAVARYKNGKEVTLDSRELRLVNSLQNQATTLGYEIPITTLTTIIKSIVEQKFFTVAPADYFPVRVGQGAWSHFLTTFRSFSVGDAWETGLVNTGGQNGRLASADTGVDAINVQVFSWAKEITWTIMDLEFAARSGNWDIITSKERARKQNWDLGIQRLAFLGAQGQNGIGGNFVGLLNQAGITTNTTLITKPIKDMTPSELKVFQENIIEVYRAACNRTAWPTHFVLPESDFNGLASQSSPTFPLKSTLQLLLEMFIVITGNKDFKILPLSYADASYHSDVAQIAGKQVYALYNADEDSLRMDVPVAYTNTLANSINNFSFQNVGYGQCTGAMAYRPLEMVYFTYNA